MSADEQAEMRELQRRLKTPRGLSWPELSRLWGLERRAEATDGWRQVRDLTDAEWLSIGEAKIN